MQVWDVCGFSRTRGCFIKDSGVGCGDSCLGCGFSRFCMVVAGILV